VLPSMCNTVKAGNATFTFIHLADAFIQSDLQLLYMSEPHASGATRG